MYRSPTFAIHHWLKISLYGVIHTLKERGESSRLSCELAHAIWKARSPQSSICKLELQVLVVYSLIWFKLLELFLDSLSYNTEFRTYLVGPGTNWSDSTLCSFAQLSLYFTNAFAWFLSGNCKNNAEESAVFLQDNNLKWGHYSFCKQASPFWYGGCHIGGEWCSWRRQKFGCPQPIGIPCSIHFQIRTFLPNHRSFRTEDSCGLKFT